MPQFSWYLNPLEDWDFQARIRAGKLVMKKPNTPDRHIVMQADDKNPAVNLTDQSIPLDQDRTKLVPEQEGQLAGDWSAHFLDKLYGHPQHYRAPANIPGCHVIGLFNGDLIIDAISTKRPGEMHYTFNRTTKMLQRVTGISLRGGWKAPPIHLGDTPGNEQLRSREPEAVDEEMKDVVAKFEKPMDESAGTRNIRLTFDKNDDAVALATLAENGTVEKEVHRMTYQAHNVLTLIAARTTQNRRGADSNATIDMIPPPNKRIEDSDATIDLPEENMDVDSNATIDVHEDHAPSETETIDDPDLTDTEDWNATYPQRPRSANMASKAVLEERARVEYHGKLGRVSEREKRDQLRAVGEAATMAARAVLVAFDRDTLSTGVDGKRDPDETGTVAEEAQDWRCGEGEEMDIDEGNATQDFIQDMDVIVDSIHSPPPPRQGDDKSPDHIRTTLTHSPGLLINPLTSPLLPESNDRPQLPTVSQPYPQYTPHQLTLIHEIEQAAAVASQAALTVIHKNPKPSQLRFIEEAAAVAAQTALEMQGRVEREIALEARGKTGAQEAGDDDEELESVDGDAEDREKEV